MRAEYLLILAGLLAGCTTYGATASPVTDETALDVPGLVGRWLAVTPAETPEGDPDSTWLTIASPTPGWYRVSAVCEYCDSKAAMRARVRRIGAELFAATQREFADSSLYEDDAVLALYEFYRVWFRNDSLFVVALNPRSLRTFLRDHPGELEFAEPAGHGPDILLTASPDALTGFLALQAHDAMLWSGEEEIPFGRVP